MTAKQTPGPWTLSDDPVRRVIRGAGARPRTVCIVEDWTTEPDARLLAAAPSLADALEAALAFFDGSITFEHSVGTNARAALRAAGRLASKASAAQRPPDSSVAETPEEEH